MNIIADMISSIANVILQSGSTVPEWMIKLPKPSKMKRREMGKIKRADTVNSARRIGRADAIKKRSVAVALMRLEFHLTISVAAGT